MATIDLQTNSYHIVVLPFVDIDYSQTEHILTIAEKKRCATFSEKRQREFAASRIILQTMLGAEYQPVCYTAQGKPYLPQNTQNYGVSFSHSKTYCAVMLGKNAEVGIDIEEFRPKIAQLAPRFMTKIELQKFTTLEEQTLVWCAKEALFKYNNIGCNFQENFQINNIEGSDEQGTIWAQSSNSTTQISKQLQYRKKTDFCLVWVKK